MDNYKEIIKKISYNKLDGDTIESLIRKNPKDDFLISTKVLYLTSQGAVKQAEKYLEDCLEKDPILESSTFFNWINGVICLRKDKKEEALSFFITSIEKDTDTVNCWVHLELYYLYKEEDMLKAKVHLNKALDINQDYVDAWAELSNNLVLEGKYSEAINVLDHILAKKKMPYVLFNKGMIYMGLEDYQEARKCFLESNQVEKNTFSTVGLGDIEYFSKNFEKAKRFYLEALEIQKDDVFAHKRLGRIYVEQNKLDEAYVHFKEAFGVESNLDNLADLVYVHVLLSNYEKALELSRDMVQLFGENSNADFWEILILSLQNNTEDGQQKLYEFYGKYTDPEIEWLKAELYNWGIEVSPPR